MSFLMGALCRYRAVLGLNGAQYRTMQNNQNMMAKMRGISPNFGSATMDAYVKSDKSFAMGQATNGFEALAYQTQLDSLEKAKNKDFESFAYFM
ncbi:MAG: hypothetical protein WCF95_03035 [bacterium]